MTGRRRGSGGSHHGTSGSHHTTRHDSPDSPDGTPARRRSGGGDGVGLNADSIDTMAGRLDATRSRVDGVGDTVRGVNVGPQSMGIVGSAFTGAAQQHLRTAEQHVTRTSRAVEQAQRGTRGTVQAYRDTDTTNAANLAAIDTTTKPPEPRHADPTTRTPASDTGGNDPAFGSISGTLDDSGPTPTPKPPRVSDAEWDAMSTPDKIAHAEAEVAHDARTFKDNDEASEYGAREWNDYAENLPQSQKDAIHNYTRETEYPNYKDHNGYLRGSEPGTPEVLHDIAEIDKAMAGHPIPEDVVVTRGTNLGHLGMDAPDMEGQTFHDPAYMSTSLGGPAGAFDSKEAILHLNVPAGTPALWVEKVSAFGGGERELLLGRGMSYRVDRVIWEGGQWQIYGQIIPPK